MIDSRLEDTIAVACLHGVLPLFFVSAGGILLFVGFPAAVARGCCGAFGSYRIGGIFFGGFRHGVVGPLQ